MLQRNRHQLLISVADPGEEPGGPGPPSPALSKGLDRAPLISRTGSGIEYPCQLIKYIRGSRKEHCNMSPLTLPLPLLWVLWSVFSIFCSKSFGHCTRPQHHEGTIFACSYNMPNHLNLEQKVSAVRSLFYRVVFVLVFRKTRFT